MSQPDAPLPVDEAPPLETIGVPLVTEGPALATTGPGAVEAPPGEASRDPEAALRAALAALPDRSEDPLVCPFLRSLAPPGELRPPVARASSANRCAAFGEPFAQGDLQQQLLCLVPGHVACPRYERGVAEVRGRLVVGAAGRADRSALVIRLAGAALVVTLVLAVGFGLLNGGALGPAATPTAIAEATATPPATPSPTASPSPSPSPSLTAPPSASPTPPLTATPAPTATAAPTGLAARWAGLPRCPAPQTCYVYSVRKGDTFFGIATYYGTNVAGLQKLNPQYATNTTIHVGDKIKIPPPPH